MREPIFLAILNACRPRDGRGLPPSFCVGTRGVSAIPLGLLLGFQHNEHLLLLETGMGLQGSFWLGVTRDCLGHSSRVCTQGAVQQVDGLRQAI